jgi:DinB superfamily
MSGTHTFQLESDFVDLRDLYDEIDALLARPPAELRRAVSTVSRWSPEQHLAHISLANELVARNLASLLRGSGPFVVASGEPSNEVLQLLASGRLPRGKAQAPRIVVPPADVEREYLLDWVAGNRREFNVFAQQCTELEAASARVPHQLLGPLSAALWVRFAVVHTRHHLVITREVLNADGTTND